MIRIESTAPAVILENECGDFVWLEQVIAAHLGALFPGMEILAVHPFRVIRDADILIVSFDGDHQVWLNQLAGPLFDDSFESGDTTAWSAVVP